MCVCVCVWVCVSTELRERCVCVRVCLKRTETGVCVCVRIQSSETGVCVCVCACRAQRKGCVRHRSGDSCKNNSAALNVPKSQHVMGCYATPETSKFYLLEELFIS